MEYLQHAELENLHFNNNAYFYIHNEPLKKNDVIKIFEEARADKNAKKEFKMKVRVPFIQGGKERAKYSLDIFSFKKRPTFFRESVEGKFEKKFGYFLILECKNMLCVLRKNVSGTKYLRSITKDIDYKVLSHYLLTHESKFEKIVTQNMRPSENSLRNKSTEAKDLKRVFPRFGASKEIIQSLRINNTGKKANISLNTSRVNSHDLNQEIRDVFNWGVKNINLLRQGLKSIPKSPFLRSFSQPINYKGVINEITPSHILVRLSSLKDDIDDDQLNACYNKLNKEEVNLGELIDISEKLYPLEKQSEDTFGSPKSEVSIKLNKNYISFRHSKFKNIILEYRNDMKVSLESYINNGNFFMVLFKEPEYVFSHKKIFKDTRLLGDIENFLGAFQTFPELEKVITEKGTDYTNSSKDFKKDSLFSFIENQFKDESELMICDDMGTEWGDFLSLRKDEVIFFHAKFNANSLSASKLEGVFGQAQKNFGNIEISQEMIDRRGDKWLNDFKLNNVKTKIKRIRKGLKGSKKNQINFIKNTFKKVYSNPNHRKKVYIVVNFISKKELTTSLKKVKNDEDFKNKGVTLQILWYVSSLLSSASELNTEFRILCRP